MFADYGAFLFADPYRAVPEAARILRPGGLLAFTHLSPIYDIAFPPDAEHASERLVNDYFGLYRLQDVDGTVEFNLPYGTWIRLFRDCGLVVEDLIEPRPDRRRHQHLPGRRGPGLVAPLAGRVHLAAAQALSPAPLPPAR